MYHKINAEILNLMVVRQGLFCLVSTDVGRSIPNTKPVSPVCVQILSRIACVCGHALVLFLPVHHHQ